MLAASSASSPFLPQQAFTRCWGFTLAEAFSLLPLERAGPSQFNPLISVNIIPLERPPLLTPSKWPP